MASPRLTTIFLYDAGGKLIAEYSTIVAPVSTAQVSYLTNDHLGSPRITTDKDGDVYSRRDFLPFGEELTASHTPQRSVYGGDTVRQKFTGYERDDESGLDFAQARMHNYGHGRFMSPDPLQSSASVYNPQTFNRYTYVINNPVNLVDPSGLCAEGKVYVKKGKKITTYSCSKEEGFKVYKGGNKQVIGEDGYIYDVTNKDFTNTGQKPVTVSAPLQTDLANSEDILMGPGSIIDRMPAYMPAEPEIATGWRPVVPRNPPPHPCGNTTTIGGSYGVFDGGLYIGDHEVVPFAGVGFTPLIPAAGLIVTTNSPPPRRGSTQFSAGYIYGISRSFAPGKERRDEILSCLYLIRMTIGLSLHGEFLPRKSVYQQRRHFSGFHFLTERRNVRGSEQGHELTMEYLWASLLLLIGVFAIAFNKKLGKLREEMLPKYYGAMPFGGSIETIVAGVVFLVLGVLLLINSFRTG